MRKKSTVRGQPLRPLVSHRACTRYGHLRRTAFHLPYPSHRRIATQPNWQFPCDRVRNWKEHWEWADAHRQNIDNVDRALTIEFFLTITADIIEDVETDINTAQDTTFLQVFDRYWAEYGNPTPSEITENRDSMEAARNPSAGENFKKVMRQMQDGQRFAVYTDSAYTDKQMVNMGEKIVLDTQCFKSAYSKWMEKAEADKTWPNFVIHFNAAYKIWKVTNKAFHNFGYGGGAAGIGATGSQGGEEASWEDLDNINAAVNAANAATFQQLSMTNANLTSQNAQLNAQLTFLQQQLHQANAANHPTPQQTYLPLYQPPQQQPVQYQPPPTPPIFSAAAHQQPTQQRHLPPTSPGRLPCALFPSCHDEQGAADQTALDLSTVELIWQISPKLEWAEAVRQRDRRSTLSRVFWL